MRLASTRLERNPDAIRLVGVVEAASGRVDELYFQFPAAFAGFVLDSADPFLAALLPAALMRRERLAIVPEVDARLLGNVGRLQDILCAWNGFRHTEVTARPRPSLELPPGGAILSTFSGGVDSVHTVVKARHTASPVTHALFMKGLEQPLAKSHDVDAAIRMATESASRLGLTMIAGESNLRDVFPELNWERTYTSAALAAAALALSRGARRVMIPSSYAYTQLHPWGSHPLLDELWASERLEIVHDGAEARRVDKIEQLIQDPLVLETLRVCLENKSGPFNCGLCRKCVRTMVALDVLGVLNRAKTFPPTLPVDIFDRLREDQVEFTEELLDFARARHARPELTRTIERAVRARRRANAIREVFSNTPGLDWALATARRAKAQLVGRNVAAEPPLPPALTEERATKPVRLAPAPPPAGDDGPSANAG